MKRLAELAGLQTEKESFLVGGLADMEWFRKEKKRVHVFALGDVGGMLLTGLRLLGGDCISAIGIYDVRDHVCDRFAFEMNQIRDGAGRAQLPPVEILTEEQLFNCDVFLFCASLRVPPVGEGGDVRMAQFEANRGLVEATAGKALAENFGGLFGVVSDPVDPLCRAAQLAGLPPARVKGFGLGVMAARAAYYAEGEERFRHYLAEGRAYGPHGADLVIADSLRHYDDALSRELTQKAVTANLVMRDWGFKPYIAPALSSGAFSVLALLRGDWHYSSSWFDGCYFGARNRCTPRGTEVENPLLPEPLYERCALACGHLKALFA